MMALVTALVVLGVLAVIAYATYAMISSTAKRRINVAPASPRWVATHHAVNDATRVVRKVGLGNDDVRLRLRHQVLEAMAEARAQAALFESESD